MIQPGYRRFKSQLATFSLTRLILNTGFRMVYPFLPVFSRGLGVDLQILALVVSARALLGIASPLYGALADLRGRKQAMLFGLGIYSGGFLIVTLLPNFPGFVIALLLSAVGKIIFDPAVLSYLGDIVKYERRSRAIAITELGWSGAALIGIPIVGFIISRSGWTAPFTWLAPLTVAVAIVIARIIPPTPLKDGNRPSLFENIESVLRYRSALAAVLVGFLIAAGNEAINIVYGAWMEQAFQVSIIALGAATIVIGLAELSGEGLVAGISDTIGKRRSIAIGIVANAVACIALIILSRTLVGALAGLFFYFLTFEFTLVSAIPLMTELVPGSRATTMSVFISGIASGRAIGALIGPFLFGEGMIVNCLLVVFVDIVALVVLLRFVRE
ncbi:MAG: MFS transporter [Anaerolineales bacterium]|nr:MFS transporter [Anaerolineales bacterium]